MKKVSAYNRPNRCPSCGSKKIETIIDQAVPKKESPEECQSEGPPRWKCGGCGAMIHLRTSRRCRG